MVRLARGEDFLQYLIGLLQEKLSCDALPDLVNRGLLNVNLCQAIIFLNKLCNAFEVLLRVQAVVPLLARL